MATEVIPSNEEDDLFNFDEVMSRPSTKPATPAPIAASPVASAAPVTPVAPVAAVPQAKPVAVRAAPVPVTPVASVPPGQIVQVKSVEPVAVEALAPPRAPVSLIQPARRRRIGKLTLAALSIATLVNVALVGVVWRSMSGIGDAMRSVGDHVANANATHGAQTLGAPIAWHDLTSLTPRAEEAELALATAAEEIARGEFEHARARLYSLLSVIDRFEAKSRANLASRAQVLAADAFREQADAVEEEAIADSVPGFVEVPLEKHP